jgi:DUF4097 and DUF4098 domain-containing protein YvlB
MSESHLDGIESLHIVRCDGHLTITGSEQPPAEIDCSIAPHIERAGGRAQVSLRAHATIRVPAGVAIEVSDCSGHFEVEDVATPMVVGRIDGHLRARRIGSLAIRSRIGGGVRIEDAGAIEGTEIGGSLRAERTRSIALSRVGGNFEARKVERDAVIERVGGNAYADQVAGALRILTVGGNLYAERTGAVDLETVGGKARVIDASADIRIGKVGGRAAVLGANGDVKIATVGGHASISGVGGGLELPEVGGALDLRGPFPAGKFWGASSRGRISVEVDTASSLNVTASSGWGRVRVFGLDTANLERVDRRRAQGSLGAERPEAERTRMALETRHADIIFAQAGAREREYCWSGRGGRAGRRFPGAFDELGDILSEEFGEKVPDFVNSILGAAGQIVAGSGAWSGSFMRNVAEDAGRSVRDAMSEAERAFADLGEKLPRDIATSVEEFGRRLGEIIRRAAAEGRARSLQGRDETGEEIRRAALRMRDSIRAAVNEARTRHDRSAPAAGPEEPTESAPQTKPLTPESHRGDIMDILKAVKEGRLEPGEADEMIEALMEVERAADARGI